jgi:hypothetical protein
VIAIEPTIVDPESKFEAAVTDGCKEILIGAGLRFAFLPRLGLDIALLIDHQSGPRWRFIEAKSFFLPAPRWSSNRQSEGRRPSTRHTASV